MAEFTDLINVVPEVTDIAAGTTFDVLQTFDINFSTDEHGAQQVVVVPAPDNQDIKVVTDINDVLDVIDKVEKEDIKEEVVNEGKAILDALTGFGAGNMNHSQVKQESQLNQVSVKIIEQPASNRLRFRYQCEGRSAGALQGASNTPQNKSVPTIQIQGYQGPATVVVSCVEEKGDASGRYRTHPHNLVGKHCLKGVCRVDVNETDMTAAFANVGIQCVKKKDVAASLNDRQKINVDPFKLGFNHINDPMNLNAIRLCFQVFLRIPGRNPIVVPPVVSQVIRDRKAHGDLSIVTMSDNWSPVEGGKKILLFCEKVVRDDIQVHFEYKDRYGQDQLLMGHFTPNDVHKQYGIALTTPPLTDQKITEKVHAQMVLFKPSEQAHSDPVDFYFHPKPEFENEGMRAPALIPNKQGTKRPKPVRAQEESNDSSRMREIRPKYKASGSGGGVVEIEESKVKVEPLFTDQVLSMNDISQLIHDPSSKSSVPAELGDDVPLPASAELNPSFFENLTDNLRSNDQDMNNLSGNLSGMRIRARNTAQDLNTPPVSMEQSSKNNLDL